MKLWHKILIALGVVLAALVIWYVSKPVPTQGDWQSQLSVLSTAEMGGDLVTVKNIRNFRYEGGEAEEQMRPAYYDKTYDLKRLTKVWYIAEPFKELPTVAAHTMLSFEFSTGDFLTISIEARKLKGQDYNLFYGLLRTYPLMYIAADERDVVLLRANIRQSEVFVYPVRTTPEKARVLLVDMLETMNDLTVHPRWYNTFTDNCTSRIAYHVNKISPDRLSGTPWQSWISGYADAFALEEGFLDTDLPLDQARAKYNISKRSQEIGNVPDYSRRIREFTQ